MKYISYNDGLLPAGRRPRLYFVRGGDFKKFEGSTVSGWCLVITSTYEKNGKWSNTTFKLGMPDDVVSVEMVSPLHGVYGDSCQSWDDLAASMGISMSTARQIITKEYAKTAERLDMIDQF